MKVFDAGGDRMKQHDSTPLLALYATSGCHLCEQAADLIRSVVPIPFRTVEIADDENLMERYGVRIPVLRRLDTGEELDWPFDAAAVRRLA
jgi:hypothetical protein